MLDISTVLDGTDTSICMFNHEKIDLADITS